jgi:adenylate cyclase
MVRYLIHRPKWLVVVAGLLIFWLSQSQWLSQSLLWQKAEGTLTDRRYLLRGQDLPDRKVQLVGLGSSSFKLDTLSPEEINGSPTLQSMQHPWPWDRSVYAAILEKLMNAGAEVVMFDFVFASQTAGDETFAQTLQKYQDQVVIGEMIADETGTGSTTKKLTTPNDRLVPPELKSLVGLVNIWPDPDNIVRRGCYSTSLEKESGLGGYSNNLLHITVQTARKFTGKTILPPEHRPTLIDFQGYPGTYRPLPVENMFVESLWKKPPFNNGQVFSNKVVIVGPMAEIFHDVHLTPFGEMPGPEVQAQMLAALLRGSWLTETSERFNLALAFGGVFVALIIGLGIPQALLKGLLAVAVTAAFLVGSQLAFTHYHLVVPMMPPLFCLLATGAFGIISEYTLEQLERRRYRNVLDRYVSKNVAKAILNDRRSFQEALKGRKQPVTVLFSDIRGFTTMTESSDADKLVAQLNEYFSDMVGSVLKNQGTLQKFIGDAIMAVWGDTHSQGVETDARKAVTAALEMRRALEKLNAGWQQNPDRAKLTIGVGVNHGEVIVGNIGHPQRMEFTVLGDGVNLAARLESATKQFHTDILVGEQVEKLTRDHFIYRTVDLLTVKGKTKPVEVFALWGDRTQTPSAWLTIYHEAIQLYRARKFSEAMIKFKAARHQIGVEDFLCDMYLSRCAAYEISPPPEHWDGSFTLAEK